MNSQYPEGSWRAARLSPARPALWSPGTPWRRGHGSWASSPPTARLEAGSRRSTPPGERGRGAALASRKPPGRDGVQTYPGRVHHALGRSGRARRKHDEERMAEGQLLELQLGGLRTLPGGQEVLQEHAVGKKAQETNGEGSRTPGGAGVRKSVESSRSPPSTSTWVTTYIPGTCLVWKLPKREGRSRGSWIHAN